MLFYSILQSLRCAAYVPTITAAHVLVNDHTLLLGRHDIFADRWKHLSCGKRYTKLYCTKTSKDVVPTKQQSMVVYQYVCRCDCRYVGRTSQRLQDRIKQHIPKAIRNQAQTSCDLSQSNHTCSSAIGQHLLNNKKCAAQYDDNQFSILAKGRTLFHLSTLEATFIKMLKPELCRQKEFVYTLKLRH